VASQIGVSSQKSVNLYPLKFEPIYQYRVWGGRRLAGFLSKPLPAGESVGEAWLLSDREAKSSIVSAGSLKGKSLTELLALYPVELMGELAGKFARFPLLLKFLDAKETLSVQVHPSDRQTKLIPRGESGKTEAWVVLATGPEAKIYAGLKQGTTEPVLRNAVANNTVADYLPSFTPKIGDAVFIQATTVHTLGDVVVFEIQENSDVTFRLYDWDRVDPKTGKPRDLQVDQALASINYSQVPVKPVTPVVEESEPTARERLFACRHFGLWRARGTSTFSVGEAGKPRVLVCTEGTGRLESGGKAFPIVRGDVFLLPAVVGICEFIPTGVATLLDISLPEPRP